MLQILDVIWLDIGHGIPELSVVTWKTIRMPRAIIVIESTGEVGPSVLHRWIVTLSHGSIDIYVAVAAIRAIAVIRVRDKVRGASVKS